jgi:hypothetical protein
VKDPVTSTDEVDDPEDDITAILRMTCNKQTGKKKKKKNKEKTKKKKKKTPVRVSVLSLFYLLCSWSFFMFAGGVEVATNDETKHRAPQHFSAS